MHVFYTTKPARNGCRWRFENGDVNKPTFMPSMIVSCDEVKDEDGTVWCKEERCHYFLIDGVIQYLADCTHDLRGQAVPLPELPK